jgi:hypothetical protein
MFVQLYEVNIKHSHWWKLDSTVADGTCEATMAYYNIYVLYRYVSVYAVTMNYSNYMRKLYKGLEDTKEHPNNFEMAA